MSLKCLICDKEIEREKAVFEKGKFFCSNDCLKKFEEKAKTAPKKDHVCEFC